MTSQRKIDHVRIVSEEAVEFIDTKNGLAQYRFVHRALPEIDKAAIDLRLTLFGRTLSAPLCIASMTGGAAGTGPINQRLAEAAQQYRIAMGVGSQRAAIESPALAETYQVRRWAPDTLLFANLGAVQLNYGYGIDECRRAVEMIGADALILHLNSMQEAVQERGDTNFKGLLAKIAAVCRALPVPVIAKEVSWGIDEATARQLAEAGVQAIDVAARQGQTQVVFTTGGRTEKFAMRQLPGLDESCFVQMGDFVKAAFTTANKHRMTRIHVGAMAGKLTKMGQGLSVTHAWKAEIDRDLLAASAQEVGAPPDLVEEIRAAETARFAAERLAALGLTVDFHRALAKKAIRSLKSCYPGPYHLTLLVCDFEGRFIVRVEEDEAL